MFDDDHAERTYRCERRRAVMAGILETASTTFLLLIAVRWFAAGAWAKGLIASGGSVGLLLSPFTVKTVESSGWPPAKAAARVFLAGAVCCAIMTAAPVLSVFVAGSVLAMACTSTVVPLLTQIYQENYPENMRGRLFSRTVMIRIGAAALFSDLIGRVLSQHLGRFPAVLGLFAVAFVCSSVWVARCPSRPLRASAGSNPFRALQYVRSDALFRRTLICWMLMGFANLMMFPLRVEYLANPRYGLAFSVSLVALLVGVIPNLARLIMSPVWGWLFDHMNFFVLRVILNLGFALGILTFFMGQDMISLVLGSIVFGVSLAGGDVAWSLWVTKFAPPDRVADYMSVHTFFTGVRGVAAPLVAFQVLAQASSATALRPIMTLGWISAGMILLASLLLLPEIKFGRPVRRATVVVEDVAD